MPRSISVFRPVPKPRLWVFVLSTLWLLATKQFNTIRRRSGDDFCLVLTEAERKYEAYFTELFCEAFKSFNKYDKKLSTDPEAQFEIQYESNLNKYFGEKSDSHDIHFVAKQVDFDLPRSCRVISPASNRGKFNAQDLSDFHDAIQRQHGNGQLQTLVVAMDLDDTLIKVENIQWWCLGRNFFNPEALRHISQIYHQYKELFKIEFLAITTRKPADEKSAPDYFHAHHLFEEFLTLAGIPLKLRREGQHVFYTSASEGDKYVLGVKYNKLVELYLKKDRTFVALFDNFRENWSSENRYAHFHFVAVENEHPWDSQILNTPLNTPQRIAKPIVSQTQIPCNRGPKIEYDERPESVTNTRYVSIKESPPPEDKKISRCSCCVSFFKEIYYGRNRVQTGETQPLRGSSPPSYNN